jgi:hypothetical protein
MEEHKLSDQASIAAAQVDAFVNILAKRYGIEPIEVVEAVRWVREHKDTLGKLKTAGWLALLGILISSAALAMWEGLKSLIGAGAVK